MLSSQSRVLLWGEGGVAEIALLHITVVLVRMFVKYDQDFQNCLAN